MKKELRINQKQVENNKTAPPPRPRDSQQIGILTR